MVEVVLELLCDLIIPPQLQLSRVERKGLVFAEEENQLTDQLVRTSIYLLSKHKRKLRSAIWSIQARIQRPLGQEAAATAAMADWRSFFLGPSSIQATTNTFRDWNDNSWAIATIPFLLCSLSLIYPFCLFARTQTIYIASLLGSNQIILVDDFFSKRKIKIRAKARLQRGVFFLSQFHGLYLPFCCQKSSEVLDDRDGDGDRGELYQGKASK